MLMAHIVRESVDKGCQQPHATCGMGLVIQLPISGQTTIGTLTDALHFKKSCAFVYGSVPISMAFKLTLLALKLRLTWKITSFNMSALTAFLRGVTRVYNANVNASGFSFVDNKCLELSKTPSMQSTSLRLSELSPATNIRELLKYQCCAATYRLHQPR